jgi:magnesium-transporting ATPase (P-type)
MDSTNEALRKAQTMAFCVLAFFQIWNVQNSRSIDRSLFFNLPYPRMINKHHPNEARLDKISPFKNPILLAVMLLAILLQISAVEFKFMNDVFNTVNLDFNEWAIVIGVSIAIIFVIEIVKFVEAVIFKKNFKFEND